MKRSKRLQMRLTNDQRARLLQMADEQGLTISALIGKMIADEWQKGPNRTIENKAKEKYYKDDQE